MGLANAEYIAGGQYSSDGNLYLNFWVTLVDPEGFQQTTFMVSEILVTPGTTTEDLQTTLAAAIRAEAVNQGFTIDAGKLTMPYLVQA